MKPWFTNQFWLCVLATSTVACSNSASKTQQLGSATFGDLIQRVTIPGNIAASRKTLLSAPYNGYVHKIYVQVGQKVSAGDPIISVTQSLHNRNEELHPLRAPFSGTVVQILKTEGEYVEQGGGGNRGGGLGGSASGNALVRIDDLSKLFLEATAPEIEVDKLKEGQEVLFKVSSLLGKEYAGKIKSIFLAAKEQNDFDKSKVEFGVLIQVINPDHHLKPGMSAIVDVTTHKLMHVLTLRHEFIQKNENQYLVTLANGTSRKIEVGIQNEEVFEVRSGLIEGEQVKQTDFLSQLKENYH